MTKAVVSFPADALNPEQTPQILTYSQGYLIDALILLRDSDRNQSSTVWSMYTWDLRVSHVLAQDGFEDGDLKRAAQLVLDYRAYSELPQDQPDFFWLVYREGFSPDMARLFLRALQRNGFTVLVGDTVSCTKLVSAVRRYVMTFSPVTWLTPSVAAELGPLTNTFIMCEGSLVNLTDAEFDFLAKQAETSHLVLGAENDAEALGWYKRLISSWGNHPAGKPHQVKFPFDRDPIRVNLGALSLSGYSTFRSYYHKEIQP